MKVIKLVLFLGSISLSTVSFGQLDFLAEISGMLAKSKVEDGIDDFSNTFEMINTEAQVAAGMTTPLQTNSAGNNALVRMSNSLIKKANDFQKRSFYTTITTAIQAYKTSTDIAGFAKSTYNTAVSAVDIAKRAAGDIQGMAELKSYSLYFDRLVNQEQAKFNSNNRPFINFQQAYSSHISRYITQEGVLDPTRLAKEYAKNPQAGYSGLMNDLVGYSSAEKSYNCNVANQMAIDRELLADNYEREAENISKTLMLGTIGPSFNTLIASGAQLDKDFNGATNLQGAFTDFSNYTLSPYRASIEKQINDLGKDQGFSGSNIIIQLQGRHQELLNRASALRDEASIYRSIRWNKCGEQEVYSQAFYYMFHVEGGSGFNDLFGGHLR